MSLVLSPLVCSLFTCGLQPVSFLLSLCFFLGALGYRIFIQHLFAYFFPLSFPTYCFSLILSDYLSLSIALFLFSLVFPLSGRFGLQNYPVYPVCLYNCSTSFLVAQLLSPLFFFFHGTRDGGSLWSLFLYLFPPFVCPLLSPLYPFFYMILEEGFSLFLPFVSLPTRMVRDIGFYLFPICSCTYLPILSPYFSVLDFVSFTWLGRKAHSEETRRETRTGRNGRQGESCARTMQRKNNKAEKEREKWPKCQGT